MAVSTVTLAKKTKALVLAHPALVERDGTQSTPTSFQFKLGDELAEAGTKVCNLVKLISNVLISDVDAVVCPDIDDTSREAIKLRTLYFAFRGIVSIAHSPNSLLRKTFQTRAYGAAELDNSGLTLSSATKARLLEASSIFQMKRHDSNPDTPWTYSWLFTFDGMSISRGTQQPIVKLVSALLKIINLDVCQGTVIQNAIAELAKLKGTGKETYWYLSNQNTAMWYQAMHRFQALTSCMSKEHSFYSHTGARQHPMDCYDDSPDWSLMFLSEKSPEEIIDMCDLVIANPAEADTLYKFPWLTRCMVLPTTKETSGDTFVTPYVFGKFYGNDKLVNLMQANQDELYHHHENGLLSGKTALQGGKIKVIMSSRSGYEDHYLLPYFDKSNRAELITDADGTQWWKALGASNNATINPIAQCSYDSGSAYFLMAYSPFLTGQYSLDSYTLNETFPTIFGPENERYRREYTSHVVAGTPTMLPSSLFVNIGSSRVLYSETINLYDGTRAITAEVLANTDRYKRIEGFGLLDLEDPTHKTTFNNIQGNA